VRSAFCQQGSKQFVTRNLRICYFSAPAERTRARHQSGAGGVDHHRRGRNRRQKLRNCLAPSRTVPGDFRGVGIGRGGGEKREIEYRKFWARLRAFSLVKCVNVNRVVTASGPRFVPRFVDTGKMLNRVFLLQARQPRSLTAYEKVTRSKPSGRRLIRLAASHTRASRATARRRRWPRGPGRWRRPSGVSA
jgi:hypothetical protein